MLCPNLTNENQTERILSLNVMGSTGTDGSCEGTVPGSLLWVTFSFNFGYPLGECDNYTQIFNGTHYTFHINNIHSIHTIEIVGSYIIP